MYRVTRLADAVRVSYEIEGLASEPQVDVALHGLGLRLYENADLPESIKGALWRGVCIVRAGLSSGYRCAVKAHELGHHLLHHGSSLYEESAAGLMRSKQEHEAQVFAGALLIGSPRSVGFDQRLHDAYEQGYPLEFLFSYTNALIVSSGGMAYPDDGPPYPIAALDRFDVDLDAPIGRVRGVYRVPSVYGGGI